MSSAAASAIAPIHRALDTLVIIDSAVEHLTHLAEGVRSNTEVVILDANSDGIDQITAALRVRPQIQRVHLVSHGSPGCLVLGNGQLSLATLQDYAQQLPTWFTGSEANLLLYGCHVAAGDAGAEFLQKLHNLTGATIAASSSRIGCQALGGNWQLDVQTAPVVASPAFEPDTLLTYPGVLANDAFDLIGLTQLREDPRFANIDGSGVSVAVIDTGIDPNHPLLRDNFLQGVDFTNSGSFDDTIGHGTHVSGTVGASDPEFGVATEAGLIGLKVFGPLGVAFQRDIEEALQWVLDNREEFNIVAVNLSLGVPVTFLTQDVSFRGIYDDLVAQLQEEGVTIVASAGNDYPAQAVEEDPSQFEDVITPTLQARLDDEQVGTEGVSFPASNATITAGAVNPDDVSFIFGSEYGVPRIDFDAAPDRITAISQRLAEEDFGFDSFLFAPGTNIFSTVPGGGIGSKSGTSMAAPHIAGVVALLQDAALEFTGSPLTPEQVIELLRETADVITDGDDEVDNVVNTGDDYLRLNVFKAVETLFENAQAGDGNGTINDATAGPRLDGNPVVPLAEPQTSTIPLDPDGLIENANSVLLGTNPEPLTLTGNVGTDRNGEFLVGDGDVDFYRFVTPDSGFFSIDIDTPVDGQPFPDTLIRIFVDEQAGQDFDNDGVQGEGIVEIAAQELVGGPDNGLGKVRLDITSILKDAGVLDFFEGVSFPPNIREEVQGEGDLVLENGQPVGHTTDSFTEGEVVRDEIIYVGISNAENDSYDPNVLDESRLLEGEGEQRQGEYTVTISFLSADLDGSIPQAFPKLIDLETFNQLPELDRAETVGQDTVLDASGNAVLVDPGEDVEALRAALAELTDLVGVVETPEFERPVLVTNVGNRDVFFGRINSPEAGILEIDIDSFDAPTELLAANPNGAVDTSVLLFDSEGNRLAADRGSSRAGEAPQDPYLFFEIAANTDYFLAVTGDGNESIDPFAIGSGPGSSDLGEHVVSAQLLPLATKTDLTDDTTTSGSVQSIAFEEILQGEIFRDGDFWVGAKDVDLYRFIPTQSGLVNIRTYTSLEFSADTFLRFFAADGQEIASNDDISDTNKDSSLTVDVVADTPYFIGVSGTENSSYDPLTGEGTVEGSQGIYAITIADGSFSPVEPEVPINVFGTPDADNFDTEVPDEKKFVGDNQNLFTGSGNDSVDVTFAPGGNRIDLGSSDDFLFGGTNNRIIAGSGDDSLFVGSGGGNNTITGGAGMDQFWLVTDTVDLPTEANTITDFTIDEDVIGFGTTNLDFDALDLTQDGSNTIVNALGKDLAILLDTQASALSTSDFVFA